MSRHVARAGPQDPASGPRLVAAGLAAIVTPALATAAHAGRVGLLVALGVLQALLVASWVVGTGLPGRIGGLLIGTGAAGSADAVLYIRDRASLAPLLGVLGLTVPALLVHQLSRGVIRVRVTESLSGVATLSTAGASAAAYLALYRAVDGSRLVSAAVVAAGVGLVTGRLIDIVLPVPRFTPEVSHGLLAVGAAIALGATAGAAHAFGAPRLELGGGALLGAGSAGVAALVAVGVGYIAHGAVSQSAVSQSSAIQPAAGKPVAGEPVAGKPLAGEPAATRPAAGEPVAGEPAAGEPAATRPAAGEPAAGEPAAGEPAAGEPAAGEPVAGEPSATQAPTPQSGATQSGATQSGATQSAGARLALAYLWVGLPLALAGPVAYLLGLWTVG